MKFTGFDYSPYIWPMLVAAAVAITLAVYSWHRRPVAGAVPFAVMAMFAVPWALGSALEISAVDFSTKIFWFKFQRIWQLPGVSAWLWFALEYTGLNRWRTRRNLMLLAVAPLLVFTLALADGRYHLLWRSFWLDRDVHAVLGTAGLVLVDYGLAVTVLTGLLFAWVLVRSPLHRRPAAIFLGGHIASRIAYGLDVMNENPFPPMDPTMLVHAGASVLYAFALFHFRGLDLGPVAYGTIIEQVSDGILIFDRKNRLVDANPAAQSALAIRHAEGRDAAEIFATLPDVDAWLQSGSHREFTIGSGAAARYYDAHPSVLADHAAARRGYVVLVRDITDAVRANARFVEQQRAVAALRERNRLARDLHDDLGQVLGYLKFEAQTVRTLLARSDTSEVDAYLARMVAVAHQADIEVRDFIQGTRGSVAANRTFVESLRHQVERFGETSGIATSLDAPAGSGGYPVDSVVGGQLLRIVQEALTNVRKHSNARRVEVRLGIADGLGEVVVRDDGEGFDPASGVPVAGHFGLDFMRERAAELGGSLEIRPGPGRGIDVVVHVPLARE